MASRSVESQHAFNTKRSRANLVHKHLVDGGDCHTQQEEREQGHGMSYHVEIGHHVQLLWSCALKYSLFRHKKKVCERKKIGGGKNN